MAGEKKNNKQKSGEKTRLVQGCEQLGFWLPSTLQRSRCMKHLL